MAIYVDVSSAVHAKAGLGRYARNLAGALKPLLGQDMRLFQNSRGRLGPLAGWEQHPAAGVRLGYKPWRMAVWAAHLLRRPMDGLLPEGTLFHATEHLLPYLRDIPTVLTVHDLIFERLPQFHKFFNYRYLHTAMPLYCRRATAIIAISEATKADLQELYGIDPAQVTVIPEAAAPHFRPQSPERVAAVRARYGLPPRYLLSVGTIEPRKNLARLVEATGPLISQGLVDGLVLVGSLGWLYEGFLRELERSPLRERVLFPGFVADEDLPAVYAGAEITVQPSLYEGFGLPVLEAMASGSPVCASEAASLPEVGGDAAQYFDPQDVGEMTAVLHDLMCDPEQRAAMRERGLQRAALFSWQRTAEETLALYRRVMRQGGA
ncbi:MAG: glycosyltransferase family 4 protein [Chloroflexi bacterium]|jgi:glycosyltransferase involved in cell wall biosynthesis|nr:glycosyltransferase family 4 protein [Chloroflexota bacterium]